MRNRRTGRNAAATQVIGPGKVSTDVEPNADVRRVVADLADLQPVALRAWASACHHLRSRRLPPLPPEHVRRALARRGWWT